MKRLGPLGIGIGIPLARGIGINGGGINSPALLGNSRMAIIGDSIAQALSVNTSTNSYNTITSIAGWGNMLGTAHLFCPQYGNKGVGGQGITTIANRFTTDIAPLGANIIFATGGINDLATLTAAQILAQWDSIITQAAALPESPYLVILPITPSSNFSAYETKRGDVNTGLLARASNKVRILDITGFSYATHCYPEIGSGQQIHPNVLGCQLLGPRLLAIFQALAGPYDPTLASTDPLNLIGTRGAITGTAGTKTSATGNVATNWTLDGSGAGGATVVGSKVTHPQGGEWQQVVISGTYTGSSKTVSFSSGSIAISGVAAGELVEITAEIEFDSGATNVDGFGLYAFMQDSGFAGICTTYEMVTNTANNSGNANPTAYTMKLRAMPMGHLTTAPAYVNMFFSAFLREGGSSSACAATYRVGRIGVRKVAAIAPGSMAAPSLSGGNGSLAVTRASDPPTNGAAIISYDLRYSTDGINWTTVAMTTNPQTVSSLTNGTAYQVQTRANNSVGTGAWGTSANGTPSAASNIITNGDFSNGTTNWSGFGFSGKSVTGGKATFVATGAFDGITQTVAPTAGKYYEITYTMAGVSGSMLARFTGGTTVSGTTRSTNGTFTERVLAATGNNSFQFLPTTTFTGTIDDVTATGPYNTATIGGL